MRKSSFRTISSTSSILRSLVVGEANILGVMLRTNFVVGVDVASLYTSDAVITSIASATELLGVMELALSAG
jgi:hypothetical protein